MVDYLFKIKIPVKTITNFIKLANKRECTTISFTCKNVFMISATGPKNFIALTKNIELIYVVPDLDVEVKIFTVEDFDDCYDEFVKMYMIGKSLYIT
jgi:hypothetical protein